MTIGVDRHRGCAEVLIRWQRGPFRRSDPGEMPWFLNVGARKWFPRRSARCQILDFVLKHALLVVEQVAQRVVDRKHRRRHISHRGAVLVG
jgi:hypothetical protein